jgi:amphi-Trp domain-containing protein
MSDLELKRTESLTKAEVAKRLSAFAEALARGDDVELDVGGTAMKMRVPDDVGVEFEVEIDGDQIEVEIELTWSTSTAAGAKSAVAAPDESGAGKTDAAERRSGKRSRRT